METVNGIREVMTVIATQSFVAQTKNQICMPYLQCMTILVTSLKKRSEVIMWAEVERKPASITMLVVVWKLYQM